MRVRQLLHRPLPAVGVEAEGVLLGVEVGYIGTTLIKVFDWRRFVLGFLAEQCAMLVVPAFKYAARYRGGGRSNDRLQRRVWAARLLCGCAGGLALFVQDHRSQVVGEGCVPDRHRAVFLPLGVQVHNRFVLSWDALELGLVRIAGASPILCLRPAQETITGADKSVRAQIRIFCFCILEFLVLHAPCSAVGLIVHSEAVRFKMRYVNEGLVSLLCGELISRDGQRWVGADLLTVFCPLHKVAAGAWFRCGGDIVPGYILRHGKAAASGCHSAPLRVIAPELDGDGLLICVDRIQRHGGVFRCYAQAGVADILPRLVSHRAFLCQAPACEVFLLVWCSPGKLLDCQAGSKGDAAGRLCAVLVGQLGICIAGLFLWCRAGAAVQIILDGVDIGRKLPLCRQGQVLVGHGEILLSRDGLPCVTALPALELPGTLEDRSVGHQDGLLCLRDLWRCCAGDLLLIVM